MTDTQFTIGENRTRPPYLPQTIRCPSCNAPVTIYSEKSQLVVCNSCGQQLDLSQEELVALGKPDTQSDFDADLHQDFIWDSVKYKIIARMRFQDRWNDFTDEYLLFHPFHGTKWVSISEWKEGEEYGVEYSISVDEHSRALEDPFQMENNQKIRTGDKCVWIKESESEMLLVYVDGALPWLAKAGDRIQAIEYIKAGDKKNFLTAEKTTLGSTEVEYSFSKKIYRSHFLKALGQEAGAVGNSEYVQTPNVDANALRSFMMLVVILMLAFFFLGCMGSCMSCITGGGSSGYSSSSSSGRSHYGGGYSGGK